MKIENKNNPINQAIIPEKATIVCGLSGGPDSVYLLHALVALKSKGHITKIIAAHMDHEWRDNSEHDTQWCRDLCTKLNIPFVSEKLSSYAKTIKKNGSKEAFARTARRQFFAKVAKAHNADAIALGHHLHDQEETFFIRLMRGSSLTGLCAMKPRDGLYIRPLLSVLKETIIASLQERNITYLEDETNNSDQFLRNRIRKIMPAIRACDDRFDDNFSSTLSRLQETEQYLDTLSQKIFVAISDAHQIDIKKLLSEPSIMQYRILLHWLCKANVPFPSSQSFFDELLRFLKQPESKTHAAHHAWRMVKKKNRAWIAK